MKVSMQSLTAKVPRQRGAVSPQVPEGGLRPLDRAAALRRAQLIATKYKKPGQSVVAELIQDRRKASGQE